MTVPNLAVLCISLACAWSLVQSPGAYAQPTTKHEKCERLISQTFDQIISSSPDLANTMTDLEATQCEASRQACTLAANHKSEQIAANQRDKVEKTRIVQQVIGCISK